MNVEAETRITRKKILVSLGGRYLRHVEAETRVMWKQGLESCGPRDSCHHDEAETRVMWKQGLESCGPRDSCHHVEAATRVKLLTQIIHYCTLTRRRSPGTMDHEAVIIIITFNTYFAYCGHVSRLLEHGRSVVDVIDCDYHLYAELRQDSDITVRVIGTIVVDDVIVIIAGTAS